MTERVGAADDQPRDERAMSEREIQLSGLSDPQETAISCVFQWTEDGKRQIVFPQSIAEAKIVLPKGLTSLK